VKKEEIERLIDQLAARPQILDRVVAFAQEELARDVASRVSLPLSIYKTTNIAALEATVLYLHRQGMSLHKIGKELARSEKALWHTLRDAKRNHPSKFKIVDDYIIPTSTLSSRSVSPFRAVLLYCRDVLGWRVKDIAVYFGRDERTISSALSKAKRGGGKK